MKRTTKRPVTDNMGLVYMVARSFHKTTGLPLDDLVAEASLAFVRRALQWDSTKGAAFSTWVTRGMQLRLKRIIGERGHVRKHEVSIEETRDEEQADAYDRCSSSCYSDSPALDSVVDFKRRLERCSLSTKEVVRIVLEAPSEYIELAASKKAKGRLRKLLRERGWTFEQIWWAFDELREVVEGRE